MRNAISRDISSLNKKKRYILIARFFSSGFSNLILSMFIVKPSLISKFTNFSTMYWVSCTTYFPYCMGVYGYGITSFFLLFQEV